MAYDVRKNIHSVFWEIFIQNFYNLHSWKNLLKSSREEVLRKFGFWIWKLVRYYFRRVWWKCWADVSIVIITRFASIDSFRALLKEVKKNRYLSGWRKKRVGYITTSTMTTTTMQHHLLRCYCIAAAISTTTTSTTSDLVVVVPCSLAEERRRLISLTRSLTYLLVDAVSDLAESVSVRYYEYLRCQPASALQSQFFAYTRPITIRSISPIVSRRFFISCRVAFRCEKGSLRGKNHETKWHQPSRRRDVSTFFRDERVQASLVSRPEKRTSGADFSHSYGNCYSCRKNVVRHSIRYRDASPVPLVH